MKEPSGLYKIFYSYFGGNFGIFLKQWDQKVRTNFLYSRDRFYKDKNGKGEGPFGGGCTPLLLGLDES